MTKAVLLKLSPKQSLRATRLLLCQAIILAMSLSSLAARVEARATLTDIMAFSFASDAVAAEGGNQIAWIETRSGERNVWMIDGRAPVPHKVTNFVGDDGQWLSSLRLSRNGQRVVFVRGMAIDDERAVNPRFTTPGPKAEIWTASPDSAPRMVAQANCADTSCSDPQIAPDGRTVAWATPGRIWLAPLQTTAPPKLLIDVHGSIEDLRWSPDGRRLAFSLQRSSHAFIAILDIATSTLRFLAPNLDFDTTPRWSGDGERVAFIRHAAFDPRAPVVPPVTRPWSIIVASSTTGIGRSIWTSAGEGDASVPDRTDEDRTFIYAKNGSIVFAAETTGWNHLYQIDDDGGDVASLTSGKFEVEDVSLGSDQQTVLYTSNAATPELRHLFSVSLHGGKPKQLTFGATISWNPIQTSDGRIFALGSGARTPAGLYSLVGADRRLVSSSQPSYPADSLVEPEPVHFTSADGTVISGQLFRPTTPAPGKPGVVYVHGGPRRQMVLGFHYLYYYHYHYAFNQYLASLGYTVLSVNYRTGTMYGRQFRTPADAQLRGAREYEDVVAAGRYMTDQLGVDAKKLGIWGGSNGGYLTALALGRNSDLFAAGVDFAGVHDWISQSLPTGSGPKPEDIAQAEALAWRSSPLSNISEWRSPVLLVHGDDDGAVSFDQSIQLAARLRKQGVHLEQLVLPGETHDLSLHESWVRSFAASADFFDRTIGARRP